MRQQLRLSPRRASAVLAAGGLALGAWLGAGAGSASAARAHAAATTVHVIEHAITDTEVPGVGGKDVKGNILTFNNPVFNVANTKQVGHDEGFCVRVAPAQSIWECLWTQRRRCGQRERAPAWLAVLQGTPS